MTLQIIGAFLAFAWVALSSPAARRAVFQLVLISCNDDWASAGSNMVELLKRNPDVIFIQEGKRERYAAMKADGHRLFPPEEWVVHQDTSNQGIAGSVVIVRKTQSVHLGKAGFTFAVRASGLLPRYVAWMRAGTLGVRLFLFSAHRPPVRVRRFWSRFDVALWARLKTALTARRIVLGGMDSNEHGGPSRIPAGLKWAGVSGSIDGFVLSKRIQVIHLQQLAKNTSDHHPVLARVRIPIRGKR